MNTPAPFEKLAKGSYYLVLDNLTNFGIGALFWLVLARITDPASIGQSMVVIAFATSIIGFSGYGVQVTMAKYIAAYTAKNMPSTARKVIKFGIKVSLIISAILALALSLLSEQISVLAYDDPALATLLIFAILTYFPSQTIVATLVGAFQGLYVAKFVVVNDMIFQVSRMAIAVAMVLYGLSSFGIIISFSVASALALMISYFILLPRAIPKLSGQEEPKEGARHLVHFSGLSYFSVGLTIASAQIGMLVLGTKNFELAAFYGLALLIAKVVGSFSISVSGALLPTASEQWTRGNRAELQRLANTAIRMSIFISGFGLIILMIEPTYFLKLISSAYVEAALALRILIIFSLTNAIATIMTSLLNALDKAPDVAKIGLVSSTAIIALTFLLTPNFGLEGASSAMLVGAAISLLLSTIALKLGRNVAISMHSLVKPFVPISAGLVIGYLFIMWDNSLLGIIAAVLSYALLSMAYRVTTKKELRELFAVVIRTMKR